jgi:hypothetical protein
VLLSKRSDLCGRIAVPDNPEYLTYLGFVEYMNGVAFRPRQSCLRAYRSRGKRAPRALRRCGGNIDYVEERETSPKAPHHCEDERLSSMASSGIINRK